MSLPVLPAAACDHNNAVAIAVQTAGLETPVDWQLQAGQLATGAFFCEFIAPVTVVSYVIVLLRIR
jgi:hypothetical protein